MIRTNIHLSERQRDALRRIADRAGVTVAELVRRAVDEYVKRWGNPAKNKGE